MEWFEKSEMSVAQKIVFISTLITASSFGWGLNLWRWLLFCYVSILIKYPDEFTWRIQKICRKKFGIRMVRAQNSAH
jgi:hypothetical protein